MIRKPLQLVDGNVQKSSIPIFDDFKAVSKSSTSNVGHSAKKAKVSPGTGANKLLVAMLLVQQKELKMAHMRTAFLKLVNNLLSQKVGAKPYNHSDHIVKTLNTPKKRRFEEDGSTEVDDEDRADSHVASTPPRSRSNTLHSTPFSSKRATGTLNHNRGAFSTPGRIPLQETTNHETNRSVLAEQKNQPVPLQPSQAQTVRGNKPSSPKRPAESLSERLRQVEDSLQKLQVLGDLENVRAAAAQLKSPIRNRIYDALRSDSTDSVAHDAAAAVKENQHHSSNQHSFTPSPTVSAPAQSAQPSQQDNPQPPRHTSFAGTGRALLQPQLAEHLVLQATIQRATKASMKTLLRSRQVLPGATEARDLLSSYHQDSQKIASALKVPNPDPAGEAAIQVSQLEESIAHYHHASTGLYPLSPLGDQSIRGDAFAPVPLSDMSILKDKMQSWRSKYAPKPTAPPL